MSETVPRSKQPLRVWIMIGLSVIAIAVAWTFNSAKAGAQCSEDPCTYFEGGNAVDGRCGRRSDDASNCYCFKIPGEGTSSSSRADTPPQRQSGCVLGG